ncbi:hypothetical protein MLD38_009398 [Melastoma candidum]|uniref:Uncharacterized protein n=1 Tax=Melastoma candidum TaxID=119954 RepID=A0ACB9RXD5_9MYRT|nr:hypothetical protein MLD38_009398 [Melastoma candidum]
MWMMGQATELMCGGIVVACIFDHRVIDAYSANMFLTAWAEMARSADTSLKPSFCRSLIQARNPGFTDPSLDEMYVPISSLQPPSEVEQEEGHVDNLISRIFYITAKSLDGLQRDAGSSIKSTRTKLESISAFLWKTIALSAKNRDQITKMGIVVDGRTRMGNNMKTYCGNVLSIPFGEMVTADVLDNPLSAVAETIHGFLEVAVTKEHFLGLIDWVEAHRPEPALAKIYCRGNDEGPAFVVSSGQRFPVFEVDFGWGKPAMGSYHFPWGGSAGYVMPMPSPIGNGDWIVYMHLFEEQMNIVEREAGHIFRPLTPVYLGL